MDPVPLLTQVKADLLASHDTRNTQIRLYQISKTPDLLLSEGQRGALNFYSSLNEVNEDVLTKLIDSIRIPTSLDEPKIQTIETNVDPMVKQVSPNTYKWSIVQSNNLNTIFEIDLISYKTPQEAQYKADQFMIGLNEGNQKNWIRLAIVQIANSQDSSHLWSQSCQSTVLKIHSNYYALVTQHINEPMTKEIQEQKTVHFTNKVLTVESVIDPVWVTRGFIPRSTHGIYYVLYKIKSLQNMTELTKSLQMLLC